MGAGARNQDGWAIVTAMMVMTTMLIIALAAMAFVDGETRSSQRERQGEARLNLTEGALSSELVQLSHNWPSTSTGFPTCSDASAPSPCFTASQLAANFGSVDLTSYAKHWNVQVHDDVGPTNTTGTCDPTQSNMSGYYDDSILARPSWDANGNCQLWVRAEGTLNGVKRVVVAKVRVDTRPVQFPIGPFVAGSFSTGNNGGNKTIVDGQGTSGQVRCAASANGCIEDKPAQIANPGSVISDPSISPTTLDATTLDALRKTASQNGTYYSTTTPGKNTCSAVNPSGAVVFVEDLSCSFSSSTPTVNGTTHKGIFVVYNGTLSITGNLEWWGAIYAVNAQGCGTVSTANCISDSGDRDVVVDMSGTGTIHGGVFVDGGGRLELGSSGNAGNCSSCLANLIYDKNVFPPLQAYGTAGVIQNTWREITAG